MADRLTGGLLTVLLLLSGILGAGAAWATQDAAAEPTVVSDDQAEGDDPETEPASMPEDDGEDSASEEDKEEDLDKRLDALLSEVSAADAYGQPINCLNNRRYRHIDVIADDLLIFRSGSSYWVNELKRSCVGLDRNMVIHTLSRGINSACENDLVYANRRFDLDQGFTSSGRPLVVRATCTLGEFKPIEEAYAKSLRDMVR